MLTHQCGDIFVGMGHRSRSMPISSWLAHLAVGYAIRSRRAMAAILLAAHLHQPNEINGRSKISWLKQSSPPFRPRRLLVKNTDSSPWHMKIFSLLRNGGIALASTQLYGALYQGFLYRTFPYRVSIASYFDVRVYHKYVHDMAI